MLPLDHCDLQRQMGVNNLPKVVTRQRGGRESKLQPSPTRQPLDYRATQQTDRQRVMAAYTAAANVSDPAANEFYASEGEQIRNQHGRPT